MKIGSLIFDRPLALAPMEDVTDRAFRLVCKRLGADLLYTEFASSEGLIREAKTALEKIRITDEERPIAIQLFGGVEDSMAGATRVAEGMAPDFIDINCGCWVRDVALRGMGAGLLRDLGRFEAIVRSVVGATRLPVTVKTRLGWDEANIVILEVARMLEQCGVAALTVHCRTRSQGHEGVADWSWLEKLKAVTSLPIIGNGDVKTPEDVARMLATGCDGVMIGRGAIANPWLFRHTRHYLSTGELLPEPSLFERIQVCLEHLRLSVELKGEYYGVVEFRKHYSGYLKGLPGVARLRAELMTYTEAAPVIERLDRFREEMAEASV
ncbi:tRNA dihydrouridine synthase DusB [bacterium]|nr:tRNA dihydrouridine synthase DusB [bacterium]